MDIGGNRSGETVARFVAQLPAELVVVKCRELYNVGVTLGWEDHALWCLL